MATDPTFLFCVGATKAGTSWLHDHLMGHEQCHFRTVKELHYFGLSEPAQFAAALRSGRTEITRLSELLPKSDEKAVLIARRLADQRDWQKVLRERAFNMPAYRAFLTEGMGSAKVVGDVTPAYALLPPETLKTMLDVGSDVRVIYLLRDPLARLWSHVRMIVKHVASAKYAVEAETLLDRVISGDASRETNGILSRGDYVSIVPKLNQVFGPKRLLVMFYEDLITAPGVVKLSEFLGIAPGKANLTRRVHKGVPLEFPARLRANALAFLRPQYDYIAQHMGNMPKSWQHSMEEGIA